MPEDESEAGALAAASLAYKCQRLPAFELEGHIAEHRCPWRIAEAHVFKLEGTLSWHERLGIRLVLHVRSLSC